MSHASKLRGIPLAPSGPLPATLTEALDWRAALPGPWLSFHGDGPSASWTAQSLLDLAKRWAGDSPSGRRPRIAGRHLVSKRPRLCGRFFWSDGGGAGSRSVGLASDGRRLGKARERLEPILRKAGGSRLCRPLAAHGQSGRWGVPAAGAVASWPVLPQAGETAFLQFTSGSTSAPRGAEISHRAALFNARSLVAGLGLNASDVGVSWIPFFHDMGLIGVLLTSLVSGFHVHIMRPSNFLLHPWRWLELISEHRATLTVGPDFGYALAARRCGERRFSLDSLRCALSGSEPIHLKTLEAFEQRFAKDGFSPAAWVGTYGLAENTLGVTAGRAREALWQGNRSEPIPSVGAPLPGMEVELRGSDGEIWVRSPSLMTGYFQDADQTQAALVDGWLRTGDLGAVENGRLFVVGRCKDLVMKAGCKFHPGDIEQCVRAAVDAPPNGVVVFNDAEQLVMVVEQRRASMDSDSAKIRGLVAEKFGVRIDRIEWVSAGALPKTTSGKLQRQACAVQFGAQQ